MGIAEDWRHREFASILPLLWKYAYEHAPRDLVHDAFQAGCLGVLTGLSKLDPTRGRRERISYMMSWAKSKILLVLSYHEFCGMKFPDRVRRAVITMRRYNCEEEVSELIRDGKSVPEKWAQSLADIHFENAIEALSYERVLCQGHNTNSETVSSEFVLHELADESVPDAWRQIEWNELRDMLEEALTPRQRSVLCRLFGIGCDDETMVEIARNDGISRQRVMQLRDQAIDRLRTAYFEKYGEPNVDVA